MRRWQFFCFVIAVAAGLIGIDARATYGAQVSADEPQYLLTAISLAEDFDLDISDELDEERFRDFHEVSLNQQTIELNAEGQRISPHDPLLPIILAVPVALGGWVGAKVALALIAGLTAVATFTLAVRRFGVDRRVGGFVVSAFFIASPFAAYGAQVYPAMPAALTMTLGVLAVTGSPSTRKSVVAVLSVVALPWLSVKYVPIAAVVALGLLWQNWRAGNAKAVAAILTTLAISGVAYGVAHQQVWGGWTVYASGDFFVGGEFEVVGTNANYVARTNRLLGLIIDRHFGLAAWSPAFLLMPAALTALVRGGRSRPGETPRGEGESSYQTAEWVVVVGAIAAGWAVATWVALTMHGFWWSGRQVVPILPLVVMSVAVLVQRIRGLLWPVVLLGLVGLFNWAWIAIEASTGRRALIVDHEDTANPLYQAWKQLLPDHRIDAVPDQIMTAIWGALFAGSVLWIVRRTGEHAHGIQGEVMESSTYEVSHLAKLN